MHPLFFRAKRGYYATLRFAWPRLAEFGVTPARYDVLRYLYRAQCDVHQEYLRELLGVARSTLSRMLGALEALGFIWRETVPYDRRYRWCHLTAKGRAAVKSVLAAFVQSKVMSNIIDKVLMRPTGYRHTPPIRLWQVRSLFHRLAIAFHDPCVLTTRYVIEDDAAHRLRQSRHGDSDSARDQSQRISEVSYG